MISSPEDRKKFKGAIEEISNSMYRIAAEKDLIKETVNDLSDNFKIQKKIINKIAKTYHKQSFQVELQEQEDFESLYEEVTGVQK